MLCIKMLVKWEMPKKKEIENQQIYLKKQLLNMIEKNKKFQIV